MSHDSMISIDSDLTIQRGTCTSGVRRGTFDRRMRSLKSVFLACVLGVAAIQLLLVPVDAGTASLGHIYAIARNASSDVIQFVDVDLTTWETSIGSLPLGFGETATLYSNGFVWSEQAISADTRYLSAIDVSTKAVNVSINMSSWTPAPRFVLALFEAPSTIVGGGLIVIARSVQNNGQDVYLVSDPAGTANVSHVGTINCIDCGDWAWDQAGEVFYAISNEESSDPSGSSLIGISIANASAPVVLANFTLLDAFEFPQWDAVNNALFGLSLISGGPAGYSRNVTILSNPSAGVYNGTSHGTIGDGLYVILEDGPKAFDPSTRR